MGFFDFLRQPDVNQGVNDYKNSTGAVLLDVRTPEEYSEVISRKARTFRCKLLTM